MSPKKRVRLWLHWIDIWDGFLSAYFIRKCTLKAIDGTWHALHYVVKFIMKKHIHILRVLSFQKINKPTIYAHFIYCLWDFYFDRKTLGKFCPKINISSRPVYFSILELFGQRSKYISIKFPLHAPSEKPYMCYYSHDSIIRHWC